MRIFQVDAFTRTRFTGNPATVVLDADSLSDDMLKAIAREFAHAEVAFVLAANGPDHDLHLRFFNARKEAPFVGHATIAAHAVLLALGRRAAGVARQRSGTGIIPVSARQIHSASGASGASGTSGTEAVIEFRQTAPELGAPLPFETTLRVAAALRLPAAFLPETMPARIARKGSTRLLLPIAESRGLDGLAPNFDTLIALGAELGADGFFVFAVDRDAAGVTTESRMFCPAIGIPEDPVSGNAHAMLAAYLWSHANLGSAGSLGTAGGPGSAGSVSSLGTAGGLGPFSRQTISFTGHQGRQMQRPGSVAVRLEIDDGALVAAHIGGGAVIVSDGTLTL